MATATESSVDLGSLFRLDQKTALIVGGYGGIGEVTTRAFSEYGADVAIAGRSLDKARSLAGDCWSLQRSHWSDGP